MGMKSQIFRSRSTSSTDGPSTRAVIGSGRHAKNYDGSVDRLPSTDSGADENLKSEFMTHGFGFEV